MLFIPFRNSANLVISHGASMRTIYLHHTKTFTALMLAAITTLFAACGGSGVTTPTTGTGATPTTSAPPATVQLLQSSSQIPSSGATTVDVTAIILTATGETVSGQAVTFSTNSDPSAYFSAISGTSDASGIVTAKLNLGANKTNRTIAITATADTAVGSNSVAVTGTTIAISGNNSLTFGQATTLTFSVKDSAGAAIPGVTVNLSSANGNTVSPASGTTDASGQLTATVTATKTAASDVITATAAGAVKTQNLSISSSSFSFTAPTANMFIPINVSTPISLTWANGGVPVAGSAVNFSSSRGTITGATATTNASGVATASILSNTTGSTIISAAGTGGTPAASVNVTFYTNSASSISAQANPGTIQVTTGAAGQTSNSSVISVVVRDAQNNLVQNAQVNFSITADASGGSLSSSTATTDSYGAASVNYIAGGVSSPQNGVTISSEVVSINGTPIAPVAGTVNLTVSGQALMVRLGTDNLVLSEPPMNRKTYIAIVTDSAGNAVAGVSVSFKLRPNKYWKGYYYVPTGISKWVQVRTAECANEDNGGTAVPPDPLAFNGIVDPGEDLNGNTSLEPGGVATISATGVTDKYGVATATISYPKDHSRWAEYIVEARTGLNSNDPPAQALFDLHGLAADYNDIKIMPPGEISPYGESAVCTDTL